jgi:hypothetical protein
VKTDPRGDEATTRDWPELCSAIPDINLGSLRGRYEGLSRHIASSCRFRAGLEVTYLAPTGPMSCPSRARLMSPNHGPATLTHSRPSLAWAVAATWARAVCSFASSRHHSALGLKSPAGDGFVQEPFSFAVVIWTVHSVLFGRSSGRPWSALQAYLDLTHSSRQRFSVWMRRLPQAPGAVPMAWAGWFVVSAAHMCPGRRAGRLGG